MTTEIQTCRERNAEIMRKLGLPTYQEVVGNPEIHKATVKQIRRTLLRENRDSDDAFITDFRKHVNEDGTLKGNENDS